MDYPHIVRTPDKCAGQARIEGTDVSVYDVMDRAVHGDMKAQEILSEFPYITFGQIHAALAYYYDNRTEVEAAAKKAKLTR